MAKGQECLVPCIRTLPQCTGEGLGSAIRERLKGSAIREALKGRAIRENDLIACFF
jgi:hypothetical protein